MGNVASDLLQACRQAHEAGADFPTIWATVLKEHSLVVGPPFPGDDRNSPSVEVRLLTGQSIVYRGGDFSLE
jgi:hypothetical protein